MEKSFEEALKDLESLVKELENKDITLDEAINKYNQGLKLSKLCYDKLTKAELIVKSQTENGEVDFKDEGNK